jgi:hypothetical protein
MVIAAHDDQASVVDERVGSVNQPDPKKRLLNRQDAGFYW